MRKLILSVLMLCLFSATQAQTVAPLPAHSTTFTGNVRGYWFTSPSCFTITGLEVATEAGSGTQNIAVIRFPSPPPIYSATTNVFTVLFLTQNNATAGVIPCNIQVETGDHIMIIGQRSNVNSYSASGSWTTVINGITTNIYRSGMQYPLNTTAPQDLWSQASGSVSRVHMTYDSTITFTASNTVLNQSDVALTNNADTSFVSVWDYGDGSPLDTADSPTHTYVSGGTYTACNYITTSCGTDTVCTTFTVCGSAVTTASFGVSTTNSMAIFSDSSANATSWLWDFGDLNTSTQQNPTHTYASSGTYYVCLTAINGTCDTAMYCDSVTVCIPAVAQYTYTDSGGGVFAFTDMSTQATSWMWDFGDATTSSMQNPSHTYVLNGTYSVCLISTGCSADTTCQVITTCPEALTVSFTSTDTSTTATFTSNSSTATSYLWDFGDSTTSTQSDPVHTYANTGLYTVCLTVWNLCGDSMMYCDTVLLIITDDVNVGSENSISIYPNPVTDGATLLVSSSVNGNFSFEIYDAAGKLVRTQVGSFNQAMRIERAELANGNYTYKIVRSDEIIGTGTLIMME